MAGPGPLYPKKEIHREQGVAKIFVKRSLEETWLLASDASHIFDLQKDLGDTE